MKKIPRLIFLFALASIIFNACKEEEINNQQFVQNYIVGKWPFKAMIYINRKNGTITKNDTVIYGLDSPNVVLKLDTVQFTAEGKYIQKNVDTLNYTIDATGDNITYSRDSIGTWNIKFLRLKSIILTQEKTEKIGLDTYSYYKEQQLIK
ncbi:hypothetical protein WG904_00710 [Pedobacter sp. Du54]|uniref:hypothetical protein n=1 Tax=Pedobacter anseongensis TaxID=3133439 RepID=UPI0030A5C016